MTGGLASINIRFRVDLSSLSTQMQNAAREAKKAAAAFNDAGRTLLPFSLAIGGLGAASLKSFGDLEALRRGLASVMGSAEAAAIEFENLKEVAKLPGLGLEEAVRGSVNLQAAGFSADQARDSLMAFGNALATVGKGKRELDLVTLALTQLNNKSSGFGQDIRQLTEQLPQLRGALKSAFGTSDSEIIGKSGVTGRQVVLALTKEFQKLPKVTGGFNNAVENATDNLKISFAELGESINKAFNVEGIINRVGEAVKGISDRFKDLSPTMQKIIIGAAGITAALGPLFLGIGAVLKVVPLLTTGFTAMTAAVGALSLAVIGYVAIFAGIAYVGYKLFLDKTVELTKAQRDQAFGQKVLSGVVDDATKLVAQQRVQLEQLVLTARNENEEKGVRKRAIEAINKISPEYLGNITLETIRTDAATAAIRLYNEALFKGALARAAQSKIDENAQKRIEAQLIYEKQTYNYVTKKDAARAKGNAELQKFYEKENGAQERALFRYQDKLDLLDKEDAKLAGILGSNEKYLGLLKTTGDVESTTAKEAEATRAGTIKYYEEQIKKLQELQKEFETTPEGVAVLEDRIVALKKKIDALNGVRVQVTSVFDNTALKPVTESQGTTEDYDKQIESLRKLQTQVATTSDAYYDLEYAVQSLELEKEIKFDLPTDTLNTAAEGVRQFGDNLKISAAQAAENLEKLKAKAEAVAGAVAGAFEGLSSRFVDSLGLAADGVQGFLKVILQTVIQLISLMLAQSLSQAIAGATASGLATNAAAVVTTPAFIGAAVAGVLGAFAAIPKFETGGIVGGSSFFGDKLLARVNSGEMILNQGQQRNLMNMINPAATVDSMVVQLMGGFEIDGTKLRLVLDRTDNRNNRTR